MGKLYLLSSDYEEHGITGIVIVPDKITIEYLIRTFLIKKCVPYILSVTDRRGNNLRTQYFWISPEDMETDRVLHLLRMGIEKMDINNLPLEMEFTVASVNKEVFCNYLEENGCLILKPEYIS